MGICCGKKASAHSSTIEPVVSKSQVQPEKPQEENNDLIENLWTKINIIIRKLELSIYFSD